MESVILAIVYFAFILMFSCWLITPVKEQVDVNPTQKSEIESSITVIDEITEKQIIVPETTSQELKIEYSKEEILPEKTSEETLKTILPSLKTYLLHKHRVIKLKDLPNSFELPTNIKKYNLRNEQVVRMSALEALLAI